MGFQKIWAMMLGLVLLVANPAGAMPFDSGEGDAAKAGVKEISFPPADDAASAAVDTIPVVKHKFNPTRLILPGALIGVGFLGTYVDGWQDFKLFDRNLDDNLWHFDDYLEIGLLGWTFVGDLFLKGKHSAVDQLFLLGVAEGLNMGMVQTLKHVTDIERPNCSPLSFPSGHTSNAFVGAHLAFREFKDTNIWFALSGYPLAALVAAARIDSNRHWVADVVAGAGFGILSVELAYLIYFPIRNAIVKDINKKRKNNFLVSPTVNPQGGGLYISYSF